MEIGAMNYHRIDIEFHDGSTGQLLAENRADAWRLIESLDKRVGFLSAWFDDEPWLGECTR